MSTDDTEPRGPYAELADGLRAATESAAQLWRVGAEALTAQAAAMARFPLVDPVPGIDRYFELLRQATEANQQLAAQWAAAVRSMTGVLLPPSATAPRPDDDRLPDATVDALGGSDVDVDSGTASGTGDVPGAAPTTTTTEIVPAPPSDVAPAAVATAAVVPAAVAPTTVAPTTVAGKASARPRRNAATAEAAKAVRHRGRATTAASGDPDSDHPGAGVTDPRAAYVRMGKAAVSARLAERGLPRTGTLAQLVNRLVEAEAGD